MEFLTYKNASIHYSSKGKGRVVVLIHGFIENSSMWNDIIPDLANYFRVISIDLLGHGKSENIGYVHSMEDQALMIKAVLDHLQLRKYVMIGHSMGGYISLAFAELFTENLRGLCLMNSNTLGDSTEKKNNRDRAVEAVKQNHKLFIKVAIPNLFASYNLINYKNEINSIIDEALEIKPQGVIAALEGMKHRKDRTNIFTNLQVPTQIIVGENDGTIDIVKTLDPIKNTATDIVIFKDGHMSYIENKTELTTTLHRFVRKCYQ